MKQKLLATIGLVLARLGGQSLGAQVMFFFAAMSLAVGSTAMDANAATLFTDGFEIPGVVGNGNSGNGYDNYGTGATIGPWTVVGGGSGDAVSVVKDTFSQLVGTTTYTFPAQSGHQWADLAGQDTNGPAGVEVTVSGLLGKNYTVSFWTGNLVTPTGPFGITTTVNLFVDGTLAYTALNAEGAGETSLAWEQFVYHSLLPSSTDTLTFTFRNGDPSSDFNAAFDSVVISTVEANAVPLPASIVLFGSGLGIVGVLSRRRRKA